jgi:hypothetical protein
VALRRKEDGCPGFRKEWERIWNEGLFVAKSKIYLQDSLEQQSGHPMPRPRSETNTSNIKSTQFSKQKDRTVFMPLAQTE